jgi:hypothetical protein
MKDNLARLIMFIAVWLGYASAISAANSVTLSSSSGSPGDEIQIDISLNNTDVVSAMQVSIPLKDAFTYVEKSCVLGSRTSDHVVSAGVKNDTLNIFVYSATMSTLSGNSGVVASFKLKLGKEPEALNLQPSKLILTNATGTKIEATCTAGVATILCAKALCNTDSIDYGRVPLKSTYTNSSLSITNIGNKDLVITGCTFSDSNFALTSTLPITITAGKNAPIAVKYSPTVRGSETCEMHIVSNAVNRLNDIKYTALPYAVNELHIPSVGGISDSIVTVSLNVNNMDEIKGFQFEFYLSSALKYVDGSFALSSRVSDHINVAKVQNDTLKLMSYSPTNASFSNSDGEIATFKVKLNGQNSYFLKAYKTILTAMINGAATDVTSASYGNTIYIKSPYISYASKIDMGATAVTDTAKCLYNIKNTGSSDLVIDRILFDTLGFAVKDTLPIVIKQGDNRNLTILYTGEKAGTYSTLMQIYNNTPSNRLCNVAISGSRFEPNYITLSAASAMKTDTLAITASLSNYTQLNGFQLDVVYPSKYYSTFDKNIAKASRTQNMQINCSQLNDSTTRIICYSVEGDVIDKGNGDLFTIKFKPNSLTVDSSYSFIANNIIMGNAGLTNMYSGTSSVIVNAKISTYLMGDVDNNGVVSISDVVAIVNKIIGNNPGTFIFKAADVDVSQQITITDAVLLISKYILKVSTSQAKAFNCANINTNTANFSVLPLSICAGEEKAIQVMLNNPSDKVTAYQLDVNLPNGFSFDSDADGDYVQISGCSRLTSGTHVVSSKVQDNGDLRIVCLSMNDTPISGASGSVATINVKADEHVAAGTYYLTIRNAHIAHVDGINEIIPPISKSEINVGGTTRIAATECDNLNIMTGKNVIIVKSDEKQAIMVTSVDGKMIYRCNIMAGESRSINVAAGLYFINGNKILVK